jgi:hypothetical protein
LAAQGAVFAPDTAPTRDALASAQARLLADKSLQFGFAQAPPPVKTELPHWLQAFFHWLGGVLRGLSGFFGGASTVMEWVFIGGLAVVLALVLFFIGREIIRARWPQLGRRKAGPKPQPVDWRPEATAARALLDEADRLAAAGDYAEAVHLILYRSIEDIEGRRPRLLRPAFTAREIADLEGLPEPARHTFAVIAYVVEHSFFGGREVDARGFAECRRAYEAFAFPGAWA